MKAVTCDLCDHVAHGATFDEWVQDLMPHYLSAHAAANARQLELDAQDPQRALEERLRWADDNRARFGAAPTA